METVMPGGVLFDFGSTLVTGTMPDLEERYRYLLSLARNGRDVDESRFVSAALELDAHVWSLRDESAFEYTTDAFVRLLADEFGLDFTLDISSVSRALYFHGDTASVTDGLIELLDELRTRSIPCAVLSNHLFSSAVLREHLDRLGLAPYMRFVISSADYGIRKPNPRVFASAATRLGVAAERICFAGDSLTFDIRGAIAAGMTPIWYRPEQQPAIAAGSEETQESEELAVPPGVRRITHWSQFLPGCLEEPA